MHVLATAQSHCIPHPEVRKSLSSWDVFLFSQETSMKNSHCGRLTIECLSLPSGLRRTLGKDSCVKKVDTECWGSIEQCPKPASMVCKGFLEVVTFKIDFEG